jgi:hypothetical protein
VQMSNRTPVTPQLAAEIAAELARRHPVKYVRLPPSEDASVDAYNLLVASLSGQQQMAETIVQHQIPHGDLAPLLGAVVGMLLALFREGIAPASHPVYLERLRLIAEERASARMAEIRGE